jgi:hypothetical protein
MHAHLICLEIFKVEETYMRDFSHQKNHLAQIVYNLDNDDKFRIFKKYFNSLLDRRCVLKEKDSMLLNFSNNDENFTSLSLLNIDDENYYIRIAESQYSPFKAASSLVNNQKIRL